MTLARHKILAMDPGHPGQMQAMEDHFEVIRPGKPDPEAAIRAHQDDIQAITTFLTPVRAPLIKALPALEMIAVGAVGLDHIDLELAASRNITVTNTPDVLTDDTADIGMMLMLNLARRGVEGDAYIRAGMWASSGPLPLGRTLTGKVVGIVGLGRIGQALARRAAAFHMQVMYTGPSRKSEHPYEYVSDLKALAQACDFLVLTCPGGDDTHHLITYDILQALGPEGYIVNIARGSVIHQQDLLMALSNKAIAGAGLDVYDNEPNVPEELIRMDQVVLSPHIGSATLETRRKMGDIVVQNLIEHFRGGRLLTPVRL